MRTKILVPIKAVLILCTVFFLTGTTGCLQKDNTPIPLAYPQGPLIIIGDGIANGRELLEGELPFPLLIDETLTEMQSRLNAISFSSEGITTSEGLMLLSSTMSEHKPSTVIIALGYADMAIGRSPDVISKNLRSMARMARQKGVRIVFCAFGTAPIYTELRNEYDAIIVPDYLRGVKTNPTLLSDRRPYPNQEGHRLIKQTIWSVIKSEIFSSVM